MAGGGAVAQQMTALEAFVSNEAELRTVFEGKATERQRDVNRAKHKKQGFLNELVHIKLNDREGYLVEEWKIVRRRISHHKIHALIRRTSTPDVEVDFFYDTTGVPIWMEDLLLKSEKTPNFYTIVPLVKRFPVDIRTNPQYEGQTAFLIKEVPAHTKDGQTEVKQDTIREWMLCAIDEEDPHSVPLRAKIPPVEAVIKEIDKKIKGVSKMTFYDEDGKPMDDDKADQERDAIYEQYGNDRLKAEKRLKKFTINLETHKLWRRTIAMDIVMEEVDANTDAATWRLRFYGHDDAMEMEDLLIKKNDWAGIRVACPSSPVQVGLTTLEVPPYACRGPLPNGSNPMLPDYSDLAVNVAGARFFRIPHGVGAFKALDNKEARIKDDHFGMYYGRFELGKKVGISFEMDDVSVYSGKFLNGYRKGAGRIDWGDGTTIVGDFKQDVQIDNKVTMLFDNPYMDGEPTGRVEILFGDGAIYRGEMKDGRINGEGEYQSALNEILLGTFEDGVLHGENCYRKNNSGEEFRGNFEQGELHGQGIYKNARGDSYDGYWDHNMRHGRGCAKYHKLGKYRGYFVNNTRNGKGELEFQRRPRVKKKKKRFATEEEKEAQEKLEEEEEKERQRRGEDQGVAEDGKLNSEFMKLFQGYFLSDQIANGGTIMNLDTQTPTVISRRDKRRLQPITFVLESNKRNMKRLQRNVEKLVDMELFMRNVITEKKFKMFRQQRHYTKKSMFQTDKWGGFDKQELKNRNDIRERRLTKQTDAILRPKNTVVPNLQNLDVHRMTHLSDIYKNIRPQREDGRTDQVKTLFIKAAVSDFEEVVERQRYLKYDAIWKRAEDHFHDKKRAAKAASMGDAG